MPYTHPILTYVLAVVNRRLCVNLGKRGNLPTASRQRAVSRVLLPVFIAGQRLFFYDVFYARLMPDIADATAPAAAPWSSVNESYWRKQ